MEFQLPDKAVRELTWYARPLGITFKISDVRIEGQELVVVESANFVATMKGVEEGLVLKRFGDDYRMLEAAKGQTFKAVVDDLNRFINRLPEHEMQPETGSLL